MAEELAVNFATWDDILETHADIVAMNNIIEAHDMANSVQAERLRAVEVLLREPYFAKIALQFKEGASGQGALHRLGGHFGRELPAPGRGLAKPRGRGVLQPDHGPHLLCGRRAHHPRGLASCAASSKSKRTVSSPTSTRMWPSRTSCCSRRFPAGARPTCRPSRPPSSASRTPSCATRTCRCCRWRASPARARPRCSCSASRICSTSIAARWIPPRCSSSRRTRCSAATSTACCPTSASATRRSSPGRSSCSPLLARRARRGRERRAA